MNNSTLPHQQIILIVDDIMYSFDALSDFLAVTGFEIWRARNGKEALKLMEKNLPDLILLDVIMPEMDGFEVYQHLKSQEKTQNIPIIFMTTDISHQLKILEFGVAYVTKPIQYQELLSYIKIHLNIQ